ncbi:MAG TPA: MlaA family lipoprotein, partial [Casimicrobiaceae bacterium]|nr:MlaA family lipoprotein [Casimicrobiaceae bacterium]
MRAFVHVTTIVIAAAMSGCALGPTRDDPFEPMNRVSYQVHQVVDGRIVKPIAQAYVDYTPKPVRQAVTNFFGNIDDMFSVVNDLLQGKPDKAGNDLGRVITNTGFGIL